MKPEKRPIKDRMTAARRTGAILALMTCPKIEDAAKMAKVGRTTLFRWMDDPAFMDELTAARSAAFTAGLNTLKGMMDKAVGVLGGLLDARSEAIRLRATVAVVELSLRVHEGGELLDRLTRLEGLAGPGEPMELKFKFGDPNDR